MMKKVLLFTLLSANNLVENHAFSQQDGSRRAALGWIGGAVAGCIAGPQVSNAGEMDVENFLKSGGVAMPMGVSGQAGKAKPQTGVVLRDGSDLNRDSRTGSVLAEILVKKSEGGDGLLPVVATFASPWPLATGAVYDIECRDPDTGDGAFLAVSPDVAGKNIDELKDSFFTKFLFSPTGRFSFYGQPTDIKVKTSELSGDYKIIDVSFSTLSQSTQTEIPRKAKIVATIPPGSSQAVMLVGSASALRWKKGSDKTITSTINSFKATKAPETSLKVRAQEKANF